MKHPSKQIIVTGAGVIGLSCALALAQQNLPIAIIDAQHAPAMPQSDSYDPRAYALNRISQNFLNSIGIWSKLQGRCTAYREMYLSIPHLDKPFILRAEEVAEPDLGHIVEEKFLRWQLYQALVQYEDVKFYWQSSVEHLRQDDHHVEVNLTSAEKLSAQLLIAADGKKSTVRDLLQIGSTSWSYHQTALAGIVEFSPAQAAIARQLFTATGPIALLPLHTANTAAFVWSTTEKEAKRLMALSEKAFAMNFHEQFSSQFEHIQLASRPISFPLVANQADHYQAGRVVLAGDAAHQIHPLAGQGANLGFADIAYLCTLLNKANAKNRDLADKRYLKDYERQRRSAAWQMLSLMQAFYQARHLSSSQFLPLMRACLDLTDNKLCKSFVSNFALHQMTL